LAAAAVFSALLALTACGGGSSDGPSTTAPAGGGTAVTPPATTHPAPVDTPATTPADPAPADPAPGSPAPVKLASVEFAQTHVIGAAGRSMQSRNDVTRNVVKRLTLIADRAALLMVQPDVAVSSLHVRARLTNGTVLGPIALNVPAALPATDGGRAPYSTVKYSVLLPKEWVQPGAKLEVDRSDFAAPNAVPLTVTPGMTLSVFTIPVYLFGARPANSIIADYAMNTRATGTYAIDQEYRQKLPVAAMQQATTGAITLDRLVLPARNDATLCYPAMPAGSWAEFQAMKGDLNGVVLPMLSDIHSPTANRDGNLAASYYGYMQSVENGVQVAANSGGGLGYIGGGTSVSGGDYRPQNIYSAIFNHEAGHGYSLPHADAAADAGDFPYPMGTKSGSSWGYDANRNELLSTLQVAGGACGADRIVNGVCYQRTPMSGGDDDRVAGTYRWTSFSDYEAAMIQAWLLGRVLRDDAYPGGYKQWNATTNAYENIPAELRARIGTDVLKTGQQVQTVWGTVSHFNLSPTANTLAVTPAYTGNLPRQFDPTVQADLDLINTIQPGGWGGWYCLNNGCDYTLVATYADGTVQRVLIAMGFHRWGSPAYTDDGVNANARNVLSGDNLGRFAVNLPAGHGGLARVQAFQTAFGSKQQGKLTAVGSGSLGTGSFPLMSQWVPGDGANGGTGGAGSTQFDAGACASTATVKRPVR
jgi:hypothetical protein